MRNRDLMPLGGFGTQKQIIYRLGSSQPPFTTTPCFKTSIPHSAYKITLNTRTHRNLTNLITWEGV